MAEHRHIGVALIDVEYEPLPAVFSPGAAMADGAPLVHDTDARGRPVTSNGMAARTRTAARSSR